MTEPSSVTAGLTSVEAARRLVEPVTILTGPMLIVAIGGLAVNIGCFAILHSGDRNNLNMRGAIAHVLGDLLGSVGVLAAALIIGATGWTAADPIVSALVAALIGRTAWLLVRDSGHILLEGTPSGFEPQIIEADLKSAVPAVASIHHVHVWSITEERPVLVDFSTSKNRQARPTTSIRSSAVSDQSVPETIEMVNSWFDQPAGLPPMNRNAKKL